MVINEIINDEFSKNVIRNLKYKKYFDNFLNYMKRQKKSNK